MCFNLLDEQWIPVLYCNGGWDRVGIRKAFEDAGRIRQIAAPNPMDRVAILRFLLALLYWCKGNPPDGGGDTAHGSLPPDLISKLDENSECFDLLGEGKRFYQCHVAGDSRKEEKEHEVVSLIHEIPNGDDKWHFRHSTDRVDGLCLACCALGLVRLPMFTTSGGRGWHPGINGAPPMYVLRLGKTLQETLRANWLGCREVGHAAWVDPELRPTPGEDVPLLTGLTLLPRRVWLHDPVDENCACIACGAIGTGVIKTCEYQSGGPMVNERWDDPHVLYIEAGERQALHTPDLTGTGEYEKKSSWYERRSEFARNKADGFRTDRPWLALANGIVEAGRFVSEGTPTTLFAIGFATNKAKNVDVWERIIEVPAGSAMSTSSVASIRMWRDEGFRLPRDYPFETESGSRRRHVEFASSIVSIRPHVEDRVSRKLIDLLAGCPGTWEQAGLEYRQMMGVIADSISPGFTTTAVRKRQDIAAIKPDMQPKEEPAKTTSRKKGGGK